jgi:hypothetical protein
MTPLTMAELRRQFEASHARLSYRDFSRWNGGSTYSNGPLQLRWAGYLACARANGVLKKGK